MGTQFIAWNHHERIRCISSRRMRHLCPSGSRAWLRRGLQSRSFQYIDANGLLQTVNYVADPVNGFQVAGTNLPVGPAAPEVAPLVAPVFDGVAPEPVQDTPEVAEAKAAHAIALEAAAAAAPVAAGLPLTYATALPAAAAVAHAPVVKSVVEKPAEVATEIAAHPVISYAAPFAAPFYGKRSADEEAAAPAPAAAPVATPLAVAAAAPSREAVLTTIKLNPG